MLKEVDIALDLEKIGFPSEDWPSVLKLNKMVQQLVELGIQEKTAYRILLATFPKKKEDSIRLQKKIDVFRQSSLNGEGASYFDIKEKISILEKTMKKFGFSSENFILAFQKKPDLLNVSPEKFGRNISLFNKKYAAFGLDGSAFLKIVLAHPDLSGYDFETLDKKIKILMDDFSRNGVSLSDLMIAIRKQPTILTVEPQSVISKAHLLMHHHKRGLWRIGDGRPETPENALKCILTSRPMGVVLGMKNLRLRRLYAMFSEDTLALGTYLRSKKEVQPMLENALLAKGRHSLLNRLYRQHFFEEKYRQK